MPWALFALVVAFCMIVPRTGKLDFFEHAAASLRARTLPPDGQLWAVGPVEPETFVVRTWWELEPGPRTFEEYTTWLQARLTDFGRTREAQRFALRCTQNTDYYVLEVAPVGSTTRVRLSLRAGGS